MTLTEKLWRLIFNADLPTGIDPVAPLWAATFGTSKPPEDALQKLAAAHGLEASEEAESPAPVKHRRARQHAAPPSSN